MAFEKGHKLSSGRPPGSVNQTNKLFHERLVARNYSVADALLDVFEMGMDTFQNGRVEHRMAGLKQAGDMAKEIASYVLPKLKSLEVTQTNEFANMTVQEKLDKLKKAIPILEMEAKKLEDSNQGDCT